VSGEKTAFAYSDEISFDALQDAAKATRAIAAAGQARTARLARRNPPVPLYAAIDPIASLPSKEKVELLERLEKKCRALDPRVKQVMASLGGEYEVVLIARADGFTAADVRPLVRLSVQVIAESGGRREMGNAGGGGRTGYEHFSDEVLKSYAQQAVSQALVNLESKPAPAGTMTVVLGPGWPGVLLHEAIGHGLEGDFNRKGTSAFSGRIGQRVAAPGVSVVDDGSIPNRRGSLNIDDEGNVPGRTVLIEDGILRGYLQDRLNSGLMGMRPTGNGRRQGYGSIPIPRMTNTFMLAGQDDPEDIVRSVPRGLYAKHFGGGQVDITSGKFVFSATEAYLIEDGKIGAPVVGATLIGNGPDILTRVTRIGHDLQLDEGIGVCSKAGQNVPVGVGLPTLLVSEITVGGTRQ
jgi:TldD protein